MSDLMAQYQSLKQKPTRVQFNVSPAKFGEVVNAAAKQFELELPTKREEGKAFYATTTQKGGGNITIYANTGLVALTGALMHLDCKYIPEDAKPDWDA